MNQYDHIRKNLKSYSVPVDKDKLWANTAHAIPQKRKKRGAFFLLLAGTLLMGSAITRYALSGAENITQNNITHVSTSTVAVVAEASGINSINNTIASNQNSTSQPLSIADTKPNKQTNSNSSTYPSDRNVKSKKAENPLSSNSLNSFAKASKSSGNIQSKSVASQAPSTLVSDHDPMDAHSIANNIADISMHSTATNDAIRSGLYTTEEINELLITAIPITPCDYSPAHPTAIKVKNKPSFNILLMQGYGLSTLDMATSDDELQPVIDEWEGSIKSLENLSTSIQANIRLPKGIEFGGGLQYSLLSTSMAYQETSDEDYTTQGITAIIIGEDGNVENLYGDVHVHRQTITNATRYTSHTRLDAEAILSIPVYRSFRFETDVCVKAGYNLLYKSQGTTFGPGGEPLKYSSEENPYTLQSPFKFGVGLGARYHISHHWSIQTRLGYENLKYTHGLHDDLISFHHHILSLSLGAAYIIK